MTEREKIAQIIAEHLCPQGRAHKRLYGAARMCYSRNNFADCEKVSDCVDALIEAGFGDVQSLAKGNLVTRCTPYTANFHIRIVKSSERNKQEKTMTEREKLLETLKVAYEPRKIPQEDGSVAPFYPTDEDAADMIEAAVIDEYKHRSEVAEKERDKWKERGEKAEKERDEYRKSTHIALRGIEILKRNILRYFATEFPSILQQAEREIEEEEKK